MNETCGKAAEPTGSGLLSVQGAELHVFSDLPVEPETGQVKDLFGKLSGLGVDLVVAMGGGRPRQRQMVAVLLRNPAYLDNLLDAQLIRERGVP